MNAQLSLSWDGRGLLQRATDRLLDDCREAVEYVGLKQVAYDLDQKPSKVSNALAGRDRHYLRVDHLPYLVVKSPTDAIVEHLAELRGLRVELAPVATPEDNLKALLEALQESLGPELREAVLERARKKAVGR